MGVINLVTTFFQARDVYRPAVRILGVGVLIQIALVISGLKVDGSLGLAAFVAIGAALSSSALLVDSHRRWPGCTKGVAGQLGLVLVLGAPLVVLHGRPILWAVWLVVGVAGPALLALLRFRHTNYGDSPPTADLTTAAGARPSGEAGGPEVDVR